MLIALVSKTNAQSLNKSAFLSSGNHNNSIVSNSGQVFTGLSSDNLGNQLLRGFLYQASLENINDNIPPSVILTHTDLDNIVKNSDVVTITAHFSEHLISAPTISLSGIVTDALMTSDYFDFNQHWRKNQIVNEQSDEPNNSGAGENYAYLQIVNSQDHPQHNQIVFVDCNSGVDSLRWIIETYQNIQFDSQSNFTLIGNHNGKDYWVSNTARNDFETLISEIDQNSDIELLAIESDSEFEFLTEVFRSDSSLDQNGPYLFGLVQDTTADDYSEPSGGWVFRNLTYTPYSYTWSVLSYSISATTITTVSSATDLAGNLYSGNESITFTTNNNSCSNTTISPTLVNNNGLVSHYLFDDEDYSDSLQTTTSQQVGALTGTDRKGELDAIRFSEDQDGIFGNSDEFKLQNFTVSAWVYIDGYQNNNMNIFKVSSSQDDWSDGFGLTLDSGGDPYGPHISYVSPTDGRIKLSQTGVQNLEDRWFHIAASKNGLELKLYIDGILVNSSSSHTSNGVEQTDEQISFSSNSWSVLSDGNTNDNSFGERMVDDLFVYDRALSDCEVYQLFSDDFDLTSPKLTIEKPAGDRFSNTSVVVTLTFDESITGLTTNVLEFSETTSNVASLTLLSYSADLTEYVVQINPLNEGEVKLAFSQSSPTITDVAGNVMSDLVSYTWTYDITRPSLTVTATDDLVSISEQSTITLSFTEPIKSFSISDVTIIGGGSLSNISSSSSSVFNLTYTPPIGVSSSVSIYVEEGVLYDRADNSNTSSSTEFIVDTVTPTLISFNSDDVDKIVNGDDTVVMTFTFSESMISPVLSISGVVTEVTLTVSSSSALSSVTSSVWTYSWEVPTDIDSQVSLTVSGTDLAGNLFGLSDSILFTVDNTAATASITSESGASVITNLTANILIVDLTEVSPDFSLNSMSVVPNGSSLGNLTTTDSRTFYVDLTPPDGFSGDVIVSVNTSSFSDKAGNINEASVSAAFQVDSERPTVTLTSSEDIINASETATITLTFSEAPQGFTIDDFNYENGNRVLQGDLNNLIAVSNLEYQVTYSPPSYGFSGTVTISIASSTFTDLATNPNTASSTSFIVDTINPVMENLSNDHDDLLVRDADAVLFTAQYSEPLTTAEISISGLVSNVTMTASSSTDSTTWKYEWDVPSSISGIVTVSLFGKDLAGNTQHSTGLVSFTIDNEYPTLTISSTAENKVISNLSSTTIVFELNEVSNDFDINDIQLEPSSTQSDTIITSLTSSDSIVYFAEYLPPSNYAGTVTVSVGAGTFSDEVGNMNINRTSINLEVDTVGPQISISTDDQLVSGVESPTITFVVSEDLSSFTVTDVTIIGGGALTSLTYIGDLSYQATYIPEAGITGMVSIVIDQGVLTDILGNPNQSASLGFVVDTQGPEIVTFTDDHDDDIVYDLDNVNLTVTFNEPLYEALVNVTSDVSDSSMTVSASTDSRTWTYQWNVPSAISTDVLISITGVDIAGNSSQDSQTLSFAVDNEGPQIISTQIDDDNSLITVVFSEPTYYAYSSSDTTEFFSINTSGGGGDFFTTATLESVNQVDDTTFELGISINGVPTGQELVTVTPLSNSKLKDFVGNYATSQQSSNTVNLNNQPPYIVSMNISEDNNLVTVQFSEPVQALESNVLPTSGFKFSVSGGTAELTSESPLAVTQANQQQRSLSIYEMTLLYSTEAEGGEILTLSEVVSNTIFDSTGAPLVITSETTSNSVVLNDRLAPVLDTITFVGSDTLELTFSEPVYGSASISSSLTANNFSVSLSGQGSATLISNSPENISLISDSKLVLTMAVTGTASEDQIVEISISDVYDGNGNELNSLSSVVTLPFVFDNDGDGVSDVFDACPDTPEGEQVNQYGCSAAQRDLDGDGVDNNQDLCPNTPAGEEVNEQGCGANQVDSDQDGIPDVRDNCVDSFNVFQKDHDKDGVGDVCDPDPILTFSPPIVREDAIEGTIVSTIETTVSDINDQVSLSIEDEDNVFDLQDNKIIVAGELDYEYKPIYIVKIIATTSSGGRSEELLPISILDVENAFYRARFFIAVFDLLNQLGGFNNRVSSDQVEKFINQSVQRYHNPFNRGVGKWKVRKSISGGNDKDQFVIKSSFTGTKRNEEMESEGVLAFIDPPDFDNPQDHNKDNIYEVEVTFTNMEDGADEIPIPVTQNQLQVAEGTNNVIELQSRSVSLDEDTDGDGVFDYQDNSPDVPNPSQTDTDGDGVGDVSDDSDHDGIWNPLDQCPDTPYGQFVDFQGCELFYLPPNNFLISKSEGCVGQNSISMKFKDVNQVYNINVTGQTSYSESTSSSRWKLDNLSKGVYNICITVEGVDATDFERCFEVSINDPAPLTVASSLNQSKDVVTVELSGSQTYNITHNGKTSRSSNSNVSIALSKGLNTVKVSTDKDCQGVFEKKYFVSEEVAYSPNPFNEVLNIYVGGSDQDVQIDIFTPEGRLVSSGLYSLGNGRQAQIQTANFKIGSYLVKVSSNTVDQSFVTIKK